MKKKTKIAISIFVDSVGFYQLQKDSNLFNNYKYKYPLTMQFGYSSTAIPTILTGKKPTEHGHLSFFYYDPENSPFKLFKYVPSFFSSMKIFNNHIVRRYVSIFLKKILRYTGYFSLYETDFFKLSQLNYAEKKNLFVKGAFNKIESIIDLLEKEKVSC